MKAKHVTQNQRLLDGLQNGLGIIQNGLDAVYESAEILLSSQLSLGKLKEHLAGLNRVIRHKGVPTAFFLFQGVIVTLSSVGKIYQAWQEEDKKDEADFFKKYQKTLLSTGIFVGQLILLTASFLSSMLIADVFIKTSVVGTLTLAMTLTSIATNVIESERNRHALAKLEANLKELEAVITERCNQKASLEQRLTMAQRPDTTRKIASLETEIKSLLDKRIRLKRDVALRQSLASQLPWKLTAAALTIVALILTALPIFIPTAATTIAILSGLGLAASLTSAIINFCSGEDKHHQLAKRAKFDAELTEASPELKRTKKTGPFEPLFEKSVPLNNFSTRPRQIPVGTLSQGIHAFFDKKPSSSPANPAMGALQELPGQCRNHLSQSNTF